MKTKKDKAKFFSETMGLYPLGTRLKQSLIVLLGEEDVPKSKFGISSLKLLNPRYGIPFWRGKEVINRKVVLSHLFNHKQTPLIIVLHGFQANPTAQSLYFTFDKYIKSKKFHLVYLAGIKDNDGNRHWNATAACCDLYGKKIDDVSYIKEVITELKKKLKTSKVYIIGHSNGGFMAYRLMCDIGNMIDGVVSLAGADALGECSKTKYQNKKIIHVHGTKASVIKVEGGRYRPQLANYPSVSDMLSQWKTRLACSDKTTSRRGNFSHMLWEDDSNIINYQCSLGNQLKYLEIIGGSHIPNINDQFREEVLDSLLN